MKCPKARSCLSSHSLTNWVLSGAGPYSTVSIQGVRVSSDECEIMYLQPTVNYQITPSLLIEAAARVPLRGQHFPAGHQFMIALFHRPPTGD